MSALSMTELPSPISTPNEPIEVTTGTPTCRQFDLKIARDAFVTCVQADGTLLLREYARAYEELCIFVTSLGAVFGWAIKDLANKVLVLQEHLRLDPVNYNSIQSMIEYEVRTDRVKTRDTTIILPSGKLLPNGCRTLLRLHRALPFISSFLAEMRLAPDDASSASIAWNAYSETMAKFHSWLVRHTIRGALKLTLPSRHDLINKLISKCSPEEIDIFAEEIIQACNTIERTTEELFQAQGINKLP